LPHFASRSYATESTGRHGITEILLFIQRADGTDGELGYKAAVVTSRREWSRCVNAMMRLNAIDDEA